MLLFIENLSSSYTIGLIEQKEEFFFASYSRGIPLALGYKDFLEKRVEGKPISHILAVNGPGPFMQIRALSVFVNTWREFSSIPANIFSVPSGVFLKSLFPSAQYLFLGAGNNEFFLFHSSTPEQYKKNSKVFFPKTREEALLYGGWAKDSFFNGVHEETKKSFLLPLSYEEGIKSLLPVYQKYQVDFFSPEYGSQPSIGGSFSSPTK